MGGSQCKCKNCKNETNDVFLNDVINNEGYEYLNSEKEKINEHKEEVQEKECKTNVLTKNNTTDQNEGNKTPNNNNEKGIPDIVEGEDMNKIQNDKSEEQNEQFINNNIHVDTDSKHIENQNKEKEENHEEEKEQKEVVEVKEIPKENNNRTQYKKKQIKNNKKEKSKVSKERHLINNINVSTLISEQKVKSLGEDEILFSSNLQKMVNNSDKKSVNYTDRFCVITKQNFSYYATKESFMTMKKPLCKLPLKYITKIEQELINNSTLYFCIVFQLNEETNYLMKQINSFSVINSEEGNNNIEEGMLGFRSDSNDIILKWVGVLNYFVNKVNKSEV